MYRAFYSVAVSQIFTRAYYKNFHVSVKISEFFYNIIFSIAFT